MLYNRSRYNEQQYQYILLSEIVTLIDSNVSRDLAKRLDDSVFLYEDLTKQVTNKGLFDDISTIDWLSKQRTSETTWSD